MHHFLRRGSLLAVLAVACLHAAACGSGSSSGSGSGLSPNDLAAVEHAAAGHAGHPEHAEHDIGADTGSVPSTGSGTGTTPGATPQPQPRPPLSLSTKQCARGSTPALSVYVGNDPQALVEFEKWIGRPVDALQVHSGAKDWDDWYNSIGFEIDLWKSVDRRILWSIPLIPGTGNLVAASNGSYDDAYRRAAKLISGSYPKQAQIYIRVGWEFNGPWKPWSSIGLEKEFIGAYRRFVDAFRSASNRFIFEWTPNIGSHGNNPEQSYPGDAYVDLIGMDFYYDTQWHPVDNRKAWEYMLNQNYGLKWHQEFAARHKKQTAYSEWAFMTDGASEFVKLAAAWFRQHGIVYQNYWNSNSNFRGKLSNNQYPTAGAQFREQFRPVQVCL